MHHNSTLVRRVRTSRRRRFDAALLAGSVALAALAGVMVGQTLEPQTRPVALHCVAVDAGWACHGQMGAHQ